MTGVFHKNYTLDDNHALVARVFTNIAARDADTAFSGASTNVNKLVRVDSPLAYYVLVATTPTWESIGSTLNDSFLELNDTPSSYSGQALKEVRVNAAATALEFHSGGSGNVTTSDVLTDNFLVRGNGTTDIDVGSVQMDSGGTRLLTGNGTELLPSFSPGNTAYGMRFDSGTPALAFSVNGFDGLKLKAAANAANHLIITSPALTGGDDFVELTTAAQTDQGIRITSGDSGVEINAGASDAQVSIGRTPGGGGGFLQVDGLTGAVSVGEVTPTAINSTVLIIRSKSPEFTKTNLRISSPNSSSNFDLNIANEVEVSSGSYGVTDSNTFNRASGSFITDGFTAGRTIVTANHSNAQNNGTFVVASVAALTLDITTSPLTAESATGGETMRETNSGDAFITSSNEEMVFTTLTGEALRITGQDVNITGNLTVSGTTTTLDTATLLVEDKNIELGVVATPTDVTADGGGITLKGATDKTINWINSTDSWTFNQAIDAGTNSITGGAGVFSGDLTVSTNGSSEGTPRVMAFNDLTAGEATRLQFGDSANALQLSFGKSLDMYAFHTIRLVGDTNTVTPPAFSAESNIGVHVINTITTSPALVVSGASGQTADLFQARNSSSTVMFAIAADGALKDSSGDVGTSGQVLSSTVTGTNWITAGVGDVVKVGTPVDNQVGIWTGDGTIEGDPRLLFDTSSNTLTVGADGIGDPGGNLIVTGFFVPSFEMKEGDAGSDSKRWVTTIDNGVLSSDVILDAGGGNVNYFKVTRSGTTVTAINLTATNITNTGDVTVTEDISIVDSKSFFFNGMGDNNWRMGRNIIADTGGLVTASALQFTTANTANEGFQFFNSGSTVPMFEIRGSDDRARFKGALEVLDDLVVDANTLVVNATTDRVGIGEANPNSTLEIDGTFALGRLVAPADISSINETIIGVTDTSAVRTITIQSSHIVDGRLFIIKDESGAASVNNIIIATQGSETIDGASTVSITQNYGVVRLYATASSTLMSW